MDFTCNIDSRICLQILAIWKHLKANIEQFAAAHDLTLQQILVLYNLYNEDYILMGTLAKHLHCDASNVTGLVDRLESAGLIDRHELPEDRRAKQLTITADGRALIENLVPLLPDGLNLKNFATEEAVMLDRLLNKLTRD